MFFRETPPGRPRLPRHELYGAGHADLIDYDVALSRDVLGLKSGGFLAGFRLEGLDLEGATGDEIRLAEETFSRAVSGLGSGWVVHLHHRRERAPAYPCDGEPGDDAFSRRVETLRRERFERSPRFASRVRLWLAFYPPSGVAGFLRPTAQLDAFDAAVQTFQATLGAVAGLHRLDAAAMLDDLGRAIHGRPIPTAAPADGFLDSLLATDLEVERDAVRAGDRWLVPVRIAALPEHHLAAGALLFLAGLALPITYAVRLICLDRHHAEARIARIRGTWETTAFSWSALLRSIVSGKDAAESEQKERTASGRDAANAFHDHNAGDAGRALRAAMAGTPFVYLTPVLIARGEDAACARQAAHALVHQLERHRLRAEIDRWNALQAYLGHLPGNAWANARRFFQPLAAAATLVPLSTPWRGVDRCPHPRFAGHGPLAVVESAAGGDAFFFNLHSAAAGHGDLGHTAVFGPPGSGKSVLLNFLAAQARRYPGARVFALDVDRSQLAHCLAVGGRVYDTGDPTLHLAPLAAVDPARPESVARALGWLLTLWDLQEGEPIPAGERQHLEEALAEVARMPPRYRNLSALRLKVQSPRWRQLLRPYCAGGEYGYLLDGTASTIEPAAYTVVELRPLLGKRRELTTPVFQHLLHLIRDSLDPASLSFILIDEGSLLLDEPILRAGIEDVLTTFRKLGGSLVFATQSIAHLRDPAIRQVFAEMAPTTIYLPNPRAASSREVRDAYRAAGLTEPQIERIATATPKRDYYVVQPEGARLVRLALSPLELALYGVSNPADVERAKALHAQHGSRWLEPWLKDRGLAGDARNLFQPGEPA